MAPAAPASPPFSLATTSSGRGPGPSRSLSGLSPTSRPPVVSSTSCLGAEAWWSAAGSEGGRVSIWEVVLSPGAVEEGLVFWGAGLVSGVSCVDGVDLSCVEGRGWLAGVSEEGKGMGWLAAGVSLEEVEGLGSKSSSLVVGRGVWARD